MGSWGISTYKIDIMQGALLHEVDAAVFAEKFLARDGFNEIYELAKGCKLGSLNNRLTCWRIFLGIFQDTPALIWTETLTTFRENYIALKQRCFSRDNEILEKLAASEAVIKSKLSLESVFEVIKIWVEVNQQEIREEMIEILCIVLSVVNSERFTDESSGEAKEILRILNDPRYSLSDAYQIFSEIMKIAYLSLGSPAVLSKKHPERSILSLKCERSYHYYLKSLDPELYNLLESNSIPTEKHLRYYLFSRWIQTLFTSDFSYSSIIILWDLVFSVEFHDKPQLPMSFMQKGSEFLMMDFLCVSMLINIRDLLLSENIHGVNLHLSAYPPVTDTEVLVKTAVKSMSFFERNSNIKFKFKGDTEKSSKKAVVGEFFSKVTDGIKKFSLGGIIKRLKPKKSDKYSNVKLGMVSLGKEYSENQEVLMVVDCALEAVKRVTEREENDAMNQEDIQVAIESLTKLKGMCD